MNDKRNNRYTFTSMKGLKTFFSGMFPKDVIESTINELEKDFKKREGTSNYIHRLQFIKKCEWELNKKSKNEHE